MLSQRLAALARQAPPHAVVADIGCDHGHLAERLKSHYGPRKTAIWAYPPRWETAH